MKYEHHSRGILGLSLRPIVCDKGVIRSVLHSTVY